MDDKTVRLKWLKNAMVILTPILLILNIFTMLTLPPVFPAVIGAGAAVSALIAGVTYRRLHQYWGVALYFFMAALNTASSLIWFSRIDTL